MVSADRDRMPLSLLSIFLGFVLGIAATAIAWNLSHKQVRNPETARLTAVWSIKDVTAPGTRPAIIAQRIQGVTLPARSKVIVPTGELQSVPQEILDSCEVRTHADVHVNAAIGADRALVYSGAVAPKTSAVWTMEASIVRRLQGDFQRMWNEASPHVESVKVSELAGKDGRVVDVTGRAAELLEYRGRKMLRLTDGKTAVGVVTKQDDVAQYTGGVIRVIGRMHRENGYAYVEADSVQLVSAPAPAA